MMFSYLPPVDDRKIYPSHVGPCSTDEYMVALHQRRIEAAMHKAFYEHTKVKESSKQVLCDIDVCNLLDAKYHNKKNMDEVLSVMKTITSNLLKARSFQKRYVTLWNISSMKPSKVMYLKPSKFDEILNDRC